MASKSKARIITTGSEEMLKQIESMEGNITNALVKAIESSGLVATAQFRQTAIQHKQSGITEESLVDNPKAEINGSKIIMKTGFNITKGGLASIYLDRGTPKQDPINYVDKIKKNKSVSKAVEETLEQEWRKMNR